MDKQKAFTKEKQTQLQKQGITKRLAMVYKTLQREPKKKGIRERVEETKQKQSKSRKQLTDILF